MKHHFKKKIGHHQNNIYSKALFQQGGELWLPVLPIYFFLALVMLTVKSDKILINFDQIDTGMVAVLRIGLTL